MKNTYLNIKHGTLGMRLSVLLAVIASLLCSTGAWAFSLQNQTLYYDNSYTQFQDDSSNHLYVGIGRGPNNDAGYLAFYQLTKVSGTQYLYSYSVGNTWTDAGGWFVSKVKWYDTKNEPWTKVEYMADETATVPYNTPSETGFSSTYVYSAGPETQKYGVEITDVASQHSLFSWNTKVEYNDYLVSTSVTGSGTLEVLDYDDDPITSGNTYPYLTVLKITATPSSGYVINTLTVAGEDHTAEARAGQFEYTVKRAAVVNVTFGKEPTVLIAENESVSDDQVTLNGYLAYTGCLAVTEYGFVFGEGSTPTVSDTKVPVGTSALAGTHYTSTFTGDDGTFYYRAYVIAGGTTYYSDEVRQFTVSISCDVSSVNALVGGATSASADLDESVLLTSTTHADTYLWECTSKSDESATVTITNSDKRNASVSVNKSGTYKFKLKGKCTGDANWSLSNEVSLYVCAPATAQTVLLDNHTANVICVGETSTATCISETGYIYSLYHDSENLGSYAGTGATLTWYNVAGEGTFYVKSSPDDFEECAVSVGSATQSYNRPVIDLSVTPAASVMAYKDVTISKAGTSTVDTNLTWEITTNPGDKGYLLNTTRLLYDSRVRESVIFKGGLVSNATTTYTVTGTGSRTVNIAGSSDSKTCEATGSIDITVSPATEDCD